MTLHTQFVTMIAMIIGGIYIGFATETFRRVVYKWRESLIVRYGLEVLYWLGQTALIFYVLYRMNAGEIRLFFGLACLLGFSMYVVLCKSWYQHMLEIMINIVKTLTYWTVQCIHILIIQPIIWLIRVVLVLLLGIARLLLRILYILFYPILFLLKKYLPKKLLNNISKLPSICSTMKDKLNGIWKRLGKKWR